MYSSVIHQRVLEIIKRQQYLKDCLTAGICPKCGYRLHVVNYPPDTDEYIEVLTCKTGGCKFEKVKD